MTVAMVVCDADALARRALVGLVLEHGFEVVAESTLAVEAVALVQAYGATAIALSNELQGLSGLEVVAELEAMGVRVIFISNDERARTRARADGAFFAIDRGDLDRFDQALTALGDRRSARPGERRSGLDRRCGVDRRVRNDWSKVIRERRSGQDRRRAERRAAASLTAPATPGSPAARPSDDRALSS